jgi:hypothetical protein
MRWFRQAIALAAADRILDVGGYPWCWCEATLTSPITLLNTAFAAGLADAYPDYTYTLGDGCALPFADRAFTLVFSNSVIEHVGTWERQQLFAAEARRVGRKLWVQTPAREFFIEPHLIAPFIHWLPPGWQRRLIRNFTVRGWLERPDRAWVDGFLREIRLLTFAEMQALFPDCTILRERFLGLTKSYIAVRNHP